MDELFNNQNNQNLNDLNDTNFPPAENPEEASEQPDNLEKKLPESSIPEPSKPEHSMQEPKIPKADPAAPQAFEGGADNQEPNIQSTQPSDSAETANTETSSAENTDGKTAGTENINAENENEQTKAADNQGFSPEERGVFSPVYNPVNYSPVLPVKNYKPMSRGLKVFAIILALIIALTSATLGGYYLGINSFTLNPNKKPSKIDLAARPKATDEMTAAEVYEKLNESIVGITVYNKSGDGSQASGIVFSKDGYIVTNDHIYSGIPKPKFKVYTYDGKEYDAKYIAGDLISDLAVLKIDGANLSPAEFGNSDELYLGQTVVAMGRPNDSTVDTSITNGVISALNRRVKNASNYSARLIQTDAAINPGSSGGALVNMYGQVVGVTSSKLASIDYEGFNYAIPTTVMKRVVDELIAEGKVVSRAKLGITYTEINSVIAAINGNSNTGLYVATVSSDSSLYGKVEQGDIITEINGIKITKADIVLDIIDKSSAGDKITLTVVTQKNGTKTITAELKANVGTSSYTTDESSSNPKNGGGTFDFPFGE